MSNRQRIEDELDLEFAEPAQGPGHRQRTMRDYFQWLLRRIWLVILMMVAGIALGYFVFNQTPKTYESMATIQVERQGSVVRMDVNDQEVDLSGEAFINTVAQKFSLPKFYKVLIEDEALHENPDILPKEFSFLSKLKGLIGDSDEPVVALTSDRLAEIMPRWVTAKPKKGSNLMDITVSHTDPEISKQIANGLITAYKKVTDLEMRAESNDTVGRVAKEMEQLRTQISNLSMRKAGYAECLNTKTLIDEIELKIAQMAARYGPKWDPFMEVKQLREQLQQKFVKELEVVKSGDAEERAYWESPDRQDADPVDGLQPRVTLLEYKLNTAESSLVMMDEKQQQANLDSDEGNEFTVQRAAQSGRLIGPDPVMTMAKFTFGGTALGVGLVMLLGFLDPSARTVTDLEGMFDVPILGAIPIDKEHKVTTKKGSPRTIAGVLNDHSPPAEAIRNLRAGLSFLGKREERRSFLFTSSIPGEGKSWVSANVAAAFGAQGDKTVVIDLDLRKPTQHKIFGMDRSPGISDFLTQETPLKKVMRKTKSENVFLISSGSKSLNPSELITPKNLKLILSSIPKDVDRIIIDTPPVLAVRDALAPATMVDSTIAVFKMGKTPVKALDRLLKVMDENNSYPVGIVANSMPNTKRKGYGYYGDYHYGYHGYGEYYGEDDKD